MKKVNIILITYSLLIIAGGVIGHLVAGSAASLIASLICGALLLVGIYLLNNMPTYGKPFTYFCMSFLSLFFIYRWIFTQKFIPAGVMTVASVIVFAYILSVLEKKARAKS